MKFALLCLTALLGLNSPGFAVPNLQPGGLRCENRIQPLGIGETKPRLGWVLMARDPGLRGLAQTAYQVLVASSRERLDSGKADLWDSGRVTSDQTSQVVFGGSALASRQDCWWKVRIWDQGGQASEWSEASHWTMGLVGRGDWRAEWIGFDAKEPTDGSALTGEQRDRIGKLPWGQAAIAASRTAPLSALMRREFTLPPERPVGRVTLVVTPDESCSVTVNGRSVGRIARWDRAAPFDLTRVVASGENVVGLRVTQDDGYPPAVLGELEIVFKDGGLVRLPVDSSWRWAASAADGWDSPGFDGGEWARLTVKRASPWGTPQNAFHFLAPAPLLRKEFTVRKRVVRATVYATALGAYEMWLNGERVGRDYLTPGWTDYGHRVGYQTYDVTSQVKAGANAIGAVLGDGWFAGTAAYTGRRHAYGGWPRFAAQLEVDYADGTRESVATDGTWRASFGPVRFDDVYQGSAYDARQERKGWSAPGYDDGSWSAVSSGLRQFESESPLRRDFVIEASTMDPVRITDELPARAVTQPTPGVYVVDFGQNMVGWVRLRATGASGQKITVRHGEMLNPNGTVYTSNLRGAVATDFYWLRGGAPETLEPYFTVHGFRYAQITGLESAPSVGDVTGIVAGSPIERDGDFSCSNPLINQLYHNIIWGQKGNYLEVPTDCPQRDERLGWTGDTQFFIRTGAYNFNVENFIERWLVTIATDEQGVDGTFPDVAPAVGRDTHAVTAWGDAAVVCTYALWQAYGDTRVIERHFDQLARYLGWLQVSAQSGILTVGGYGDWLNKGGGARTEVMDTAYGAYLSGIMSQMANAIGRPKDAAHFKGLQQGFTAAFQRAFLMPDGRIRDSSQTGFALAFTMDLLPESLKSKAAEAFVADIAGRDWHLATGFIGTPRLLPALHVAGRDDVAYRLLMQDTYPSWLFPVKQGATTMWERWDGWTPENGFQTIDMNSFNHYAFGAVGEYLYRFVGGIETDGPGFRRILIQPQIGGGLSEAKTSYEAVTGRIETAWRVSGGLLTLEVTVPPNTVATVRVPAGDAASVREGDKPARDAAGVRWVRSEPGAEVFSVGSGSYRFSALQAAPPVTP